MDHQIKLERLDPLPKSIWSTTALLLLVWGLVAGFMWGFLTFTPKTPHWHKQCVEKNPLVADAETRALYGDGFIPVCRRFDSVWVVK